MKPLSPATLLLSAAHLCFLWTFLDGSRAQDASSAGDAADALRRGLTWQHNGQVFSILSRGSRYRPSGRRLTGPTRPEDPVVVVSSSNDTTLAAPRVPAASGSAQLRALTRPRQEQERPPAEGDGGSVPVRREDMMVGDDPYDPYKAYNSYPYYNYYNSFYRPRPRAQPRHGYGTSYHQNGTTPRPDPVHFSPL